MCYKLSTNNKCVNSTLKPWIKNYKTNRENIFMCIFKHFWSIPPINLCFTLTFANQFLTWTTNLVNILLKLHLNVVVLLVYVVLIKIQSSAQFCFLMKNLQTEIKRYHFALIETTSINTFFVFFFKFFS